MALPTIFESHRSVRSEHFPQKMIRLCPPLIVDIPGTLTAKVGFEAGSELTGDNFLRSPAHFPTDISPVDTHLVPVAIHASDDNMDVGLSVL
jgi:hypothetical protein